MKLSQKLFRIARKIEADKLLPEPKTIVVDGYKYIITPIDSTHVYMHEKPDNKGIGLHVGQLRGNLSDDVYKWLGGVGELKSNYTGIFARKIEANIDWIIHIDFSPKLKSTAFKKYLKVAYGEYAFQTDKGVAFKFASESDADWFKRSLEHNVPGLGYLADDPQQRTKLANWVNTNMKKSIIDLVLKESKIVIAIKIPESMQRVIDKHNEKGWWLGKNLLSTLENIDLNKLEDCMKRTFEYADKSQSYMDLDRMGNKIVLKVDEEVGYDSDKFEHAPKNMPYFEDIGGGIQFSYGTVAFTTNHELTPYDFEKFISLNK